MKELQMPLLLVDIGTLERNAMKIAFKARHNGKNVRLATKSVRIPALIAHITGQRRLNYDQSDDGIRSPSPSFPFLFFLFFVTPANLFFSDFYFFFSVFFLFVVFFFRFNDGL